MTDPLGMAKFALFVQEYQLLTDRIKPQS